MTNKRATTPAATTPPPTPTTDQLQSAAHQDIGESNVDASLRELKSLAASFKLLADETRLRVLRLLMESGELNVRALCDRLEQSQPAVSHHLALLRDAGVIRARRDGKHNFYRCIPNRLESLIDESWRDVIAQGTMPHPGTPFV